MTSKNSLANNASEFKNYISKYLCLVINLFISLLITVHSNKLFADDADTILKKTNVKNGICLIIGAKDTSLTNKLATNTNLFIQVLQPKPEIALNWGATFANTNYTQREKISVRHAEFDTAHYGTNLFNQIVVEDSKALNKNALSEIIRILVPNGLVLFKDIHSNLFEEAKTLQLNSLEIEGYAATYQKPVKPITWLPCDSLKWRAGMRAHMAYGIGGATHGAGRFFYREKLESLGGWPNDTSQLVARDDFNGRVLWCKQEEVPWQQWNMVWPVENWNLAADNTGRLFTVTKEGKFVCLDGATGEQKFELISNGARPNRIDTFNNKYVFYANTVFSAETGKTLWKWQGKTTTCYEETMLVADDTILRAHNLIDGNEIFKVNLDWRASLPRKDMTLLHLGSHIIVADGGPCARPFQVTALNPNTGEKLWTCQLGGIFATPPQGEKGKTFGGTVRYVRMGDKLLAFTHTQYFYDTHENQKEVHLSTIDLATGKIEKEDYGNKNRVMGSACGTDKAIALGDYLTYHHNVWLN